MVGLGKGGISQRVAVLEGWVSSYGLGAKEEAGVSVIVGLEGRSLVYGFNSFHLDLKDLPL